MHYSTLFSRITISIVNFVALSTSPPQQQPLKAYSGSVQQVVPLLSLFVLTSQFLNYFPLLNSHYFLNKVLIYFWLLLYCQIVKIIFAEMADSSLSGAHPTMVPFLLNLPVSNTEPHPLHPSLVLFIIYLFILCT